MRNIDLLVYGATGFTGKHVVQFLVRVRKDKEYEALTWGVAGRSKEKLMNLKKEIQAMGMEIHDLETVESNVDDENSLKAMTQKCKVLINCVGPYTVLGEPVVKACIETGTHYVDISAEAYNMLHIYKKYNEAAQRANVLIIPACGFCNIPMAAGVIYLRDHFQGELNSVESYLELDIPKYAHYSGPNATLIHSGTWLSMTYVLKNMRKYLTLRDELNTEPVEREPLALKKSFLHRHEGQSWFPYPGPDVILIEMSQRQLMKSHQKKITHFKAYATVPRFFHFILIPAIYICYYLCYFSCFRRLMKNYPKLFSFGYASDAGPTSETREKTKYRFTLIGKEWKGDAVTKSLAIKISGKDPGYQTTAAALALSALTILKDYSKMPKSGVVMPGAAFYDTSIVNELQKHDFKFQFVENEVQGN
ncbi:hypothetical protein K1T71_006752 [Dendrolimus kikuchii]|uniref:Uncharacterized protein n=1 Tax=Dendrolimus kikuchii TaxID=765133 RepID=A0ACC1D2C7_9NEOP|nr:hypothetical protein K1T71_006752 [Dendrolimus kikuchii]